MIPINIIFGANNEIAINKCTKKHNISRALAQLFCQDDTVRIKRLLDRYPEYVIKETSKHKKSLLHFAVQLNSSNIVQLLLTYKNINIDCQDSDGNTPLHLAYQLGYVPLIIILIQSKANQNIKNNLHAIPQDVTCRAPLHSIQHA